MPAEGGVGRATESVSRRGCLPGMRRLYTELRKYA